MSTSRSAFASRPSQTKIVATVGPASSGDEILAELIRAGVDVFRINAAHGDRASHQAALDAVRRAADEVGQLVGVLVDLAGPKIRLGELPGGQFPCVMDETVRFVRGDSSDTPGDLTTSYEPLIDELDVGDRVMLADGTVGLVVERKDDNAAVCRVKQPGVVRTRQGVNLPGVRLSVPTLGEKDKDNATWAATAGVDFLGLSFVRSEDEVEELHQLIRNLDAETQVIAKIEKPEALDRLVEIVDAADGVMVARGDLGVETDIARMAVVQKEIVETCNRFRKPVIIATQMLDSMTHAGLPTRAEATDVANAILDGADACMLSGETAIGRHPVRVVEMMHRIARATEPLFEDQEQLPLEKPDEEVDEIKDTMAYFSATLAGEIDANMIVVASATGETALQLSKNRRFLPTIGVSDSPAVLRRMSLYWGVIPLADAPTDDADRLLDHVIQWGRDSGLVDVGDRVVLLAGSDAVDRGHNTIMVREVS